MRVNMYGIGSCHDCVDAEKILLEKNVQLNYLDFSKSVIKQDVGSTNRVEIGTLKSLKFKNFFCKSLSD